MIGVEVGVGEGLVLPLVRKEEVLGEEEEEEEELMLLWVTEKGGCEVPGEEEQGVSEGGGAGMEAGVVEVERVEVPTDEEGTRGRVCVGKGRLGVGVSLGGEGIRAGGAVVLGVSEAMKRGAGVRGGGGEEEIGVSVGGLRVGLGVSLGGLGSSAALVVRLVPVVVSLLVSP